MDSESSVLDKIIAFLNDIGISYQICEIEKETFLPGLLIENGKLFIDEKELKYIGDILHEAGHIALMTFEERNNLTGSLEGQIDPAATEMAAIAWSFAACLKIGIDPEVVFHENGYKGDSENIISNFKAGNYFGVPILQWYGMTNSFDLDKNIKFPEMIRWLR